MSFKKISRRAKNFLCVNCWTSKEQNSHLFPCWGCKNLSRDMKKVVVVVERERKRKRNMIETTPSTSTSTTTATTRCANETTSTRFDDGDENDATSSSKASTSSSSSSSRRRLRLEGERRHREKHVENRMGRRMENAVMRRGDAARDAAAVVAVVVGASSRNSFG